ncbi:MAG: hypothetical protein UHS54_00075 [Lachnospiraceae bacterium]|nr:hypothetical protein [Lachnospiraceae bacterium]
MEALNEALKIEQVLEREGVYVATISGVSMYPMLRNRRDTIVVTPCKGRLEKYDVPLYRVGKKYVLHRILEVRPDSYVIRGDNCFNKEYGITDKDVLGILTSFYRDDKEIDMKGRAYKTYVWIWVHTHHLRMFIKRVYWKLKRIYKMIFQKGAE